MLKEISSKFYPYCHIRSIQAIINIDCDERACGYLFRRKHSHIEQQKAVTSSETVFSLPVSLKLSFSS